MVRLESFFLHHHQLINHPRFVQKIKRLSTSSFDNNISFEYSFSVNWLEARIYNKEAYGYYFYHERKRLCRFYMISHGYLEYDSQKRFLRKFIFAMWCDFVLYFCLLFKQNAFVRPKNFCLLEAQKTVVHVQAYVMQISWTAGCDFYLLEKNINLVLFCDLTTWTNLLCTSFIGDLKLMLGK